MRSCKRAARRGAEPSEGYMPALRNQGNARCARRRQLFDDFEKLALLRFLVGIHRIDELESFLLELVLGHVRGVVLESLLAVALLDLDAIGLGEREFRRPQSAQRGGGRHDESV